MQAKIVPKRFDIELMIHKNDMEAWTWANELGKIRLSLGSDADYSTADGSNEAGKEFVTWLDEQRERQEAEDRPVQKDPVASTEPAQKVKEEGWVIIKMVEGRMLKYLMVEGELPRLLGEVGGEDDSQETLGEERDYEVTGSDDDADTADDGDHAYLNGKESPFYQPPGER